jgi:hypothetical protein
LLKVALNTITQTKWYKWERKKGSSM